MKEYASCDYEDTIMEDTLDYVVRKSRFFTQA